MKIMQWYKSRVDKSSQPSDLLPRRFTGTTKDKDIVFYEIYGIRSLLPNIIEKTELEKIIDIEQPLTPEEAQRNYDFVCEQVKNARS